MAPKIFIYLFVPLTTDIHNPFTASVGFFMCLAVRLGIIWEPIPNPAFPGFEPGTATMPSEHVDTELTGPLYYIHTGTGDHTGIVADVATQRWVYRRQTNTESV